MQADLLPRDVCMKCFCFYLKGIYTLLPAFGVLHTHRDRFPRPHLGVQRTLGFRRSLCVESILFLSRTCNKDRIGSRFR